MKYLTIIFAIGILVSCGKNTQKKESESINRMEILDRNFSNSDIHSIEIIEIEHPMLGGIIQSVKLNEKQKEKFLTDFDNLKKKGILKCGAKYVVKLNMETDTLRLKVCGTNVANRSNDLYYELGNGKSIIDVYMEKK